MQHGHKPGFAAEAPHGLLPLVFVYGKRPGEGDFLCCTAGANDPVVAYPLHKSGVRRITVVPGGCPPAGP